MKKVVKTEMFLQAIDEDFVELFCFYSQRRFNLTQKIRRIFCDEINRIDKEWHLTLVINGFVSRGIVNETKWKLTN